MEQNKVEKMSIEQLIKGREKIFINASELITEAELLHINKKWARSVFLSSIAIEELGKYLMIISSIVAILKNQMDWPKFWKRFRSHTEKTSNILSFDVSLGPFESEEKTIKKLSATTEVAKKMHNDKLNSLYVDFQKGIFCLPSEEIDEKFSRDNLDSAKAVFKFYESGEKLAFSKMTAKNLNLKMIVKAENSLKEKNIEQNDGCK